VLKPLGAGRGRGCTFTHVFFNNDQQCSICCVAIFRACVCMCGDEAGGGVLGVEMHLSSASHGSAQRPWLPH